MLEIVVLPGPSQVLQWRNRLAHGTYRQYIWEMPGLWVRASPGAANFLFHFFMHGLQTPYSRHDRVCWVYCWKSQHWLYESLFSSVVEHWSRKPGVVSSNLTGGRFFCSWYVAIFLIKLENVNNLCNNCMQRITQCCISTVFEIYHKKPLYKNFSTIKNTFPHNCCNML